MEKTTDRKLAPPPRNCVASGAILAPQDLGETLRKLMRNRGWLKQGVNVTRADAVGGVGPMSPSDSRRVAVHLNDAGVRAVSACCSQQCGDTDPPGTYLDDLFRGGSVQFAPGVRLGAQSYRRKNNVKQQRVAPTISKQQQPQARSKEDYRFKYAELFAGIGGFRVGLDAIGGRAVFASEIDPEAQAIYDENFPGSHLVGSITEVRDDELPSHDLLTAGFCCQSFSRAGEEEGLEDIRGMMFFEIIRVLRHCRPRALLLENVANLLEHDNGQTMRTIIQELRGAGYLVTYRVVNSSTLLPQHRQRLYIVGFRDDLPKAMEAFRWPSLPLLPRLVEHILEKDGPDTSNCSLSNHQWHRIQQSEIYQEDPGRRAVMRHGHARTLMSSYRRGYLMHSEFVFREEDAGFVVKPRFFTPRECARLQGFPETFRITRGSASKAQGNANRAYHHLGNAVGPPIVAAVGESLMRALEQEGQVVELDREALLGPALALAVAATPLETEGMAALERSIATFLSPKWSEENLPVHSGYGARMDDKDAKAIRRLLGSSHQGARMAALRDMARLLHPVRASAPMAEQNCRSLQATPGVLQSVLNIIGSRAGAVGGSSLPPKEESGPPAVAAAASSDVRDRGKPSELRRLALVVLSNLAGHECAAPELRTSDAPRVLREVLESSEEPPHIRLLAASVLSRLRPEQSTGHL